jgi:phosphoglucomutase
MSTPRPGPGQPVAAADLVDVAALVTAYFTERPDPAVREERVAFGTSGHRGSANRRSFNEAHIAATTQAIVEWRRGQGYSGPIVVGRDTHALSTPAMATALEVLAGNGVDVLLQTKDEPIATPVVSHAILRLNRGRAIGLSDGIVVTPSHNPPEDGGFKYNPPHGGPADGDVTGAIEKRANELIAGGLKDVKRTTLSKALAAPTTRRADLIGDYVDDLRAAIDVEAIAKAKVRIGVDPLGGAGLTAWRRVAERLGLDVTIVNEAVDPTFRFMCLDWDGRVRMDCSSPPAMTPLVALKARFQVAIGNDPDADRHGIVTPSSGLMNPNHFLAVAIDHLLATRRWPEKAGVGKTCVSSAIIDRVVAKRGRPLVEVPVGFKWFVRGLTDGSLVFGGEESAGASFLRKDGTTWTTDKDGVLLGLLAAEVVAVTGEDPGQRYRGLTKALGDPAYARIDAPATPKQKDALKKLSPEQLHAAAKTLAGDPITKALSHVGANHPIGGLKVETAQGWFAARPSGTEDVYKIYAESFRGPDHLARIQEEAKVIVGKAIS